ncbi:MAG: AAA family ATPase [Pseudonocardiaceae bacterium]
MLRSFRLANHRSFRDEQELLLMPSYDNDRDVVLLAAVFGANASGKSNLVDGLRLMWNLVRGWGRREPDSGIPRRPFRLERESLLKPSRFEIELVLEGVRYIYGFAVDDERVISERLHSYPHRRPRLLFERDGDSIDFGSTVTQRTRAEVIEDLLTEDTLFLAAASRLKLDQYRPVIEWFRRSLRFVRPGRLFRSDGERLTRFLEQSDSGRARFVELARAADVGISGVAVEYVDDPVAAAEADAVQEMAAQLETRIAGVDVEGLDALAEQLRRAQTQAAFFRERSHRAKLLVKHGGIGFELPDESEGTQVWLHLIPEIIASLDSGHTLVIDESGTSLHPLLVRKLVGLFREPSTNVNNAQLLFTTHDALLLAPVAGEPGLDRDQVWFVEKHLDGASELYPLTDFKPRNEHNLARRYLGGAYGAVPILDGFDQLGSRVAAD